MTFLMTLRGRIISKWSENVIRIEPQTPECLVAASAEHSSMISLMWRSVDPATDGRTLETVAPSFARRYSRNASNRCPPFSHVR